MQVRMSGGYRGAPVRFETRPRTTYAGPGWWVIPENSNEPAFRASIMEVRAQTGDTEEFREGILELINLYIADIRGMLAKKAASSITIEDIIEIENTTAALRVAVLTNEEANWAQSLTDHPVEEPENI